MLFAAAAAPSLAAQTAQTLCQPTVVGNRRIPKESVLARLFSHQGDVFDPATIERDFNSLWNTSYFDSIRIERTDTPKCIQLWIYVREKPTIREINYKGLNAVSQSDVLDAFKKVKVGLSVESQYDPTKVTRAEVVIKELLAARGHQFATIRTEIKTIPPAAVAVTFNVKEGPTVKVGKIAFDGNESLSNRTLRASMKNLRPIGIPHSILLENLLARTFDATKLDEDTERVRQAYRDRGYFRALTSDAVTKTRTAGGLSPFTLRPSKAKRVDILIPVEEGPRYKLGSITFSGNKTFSNTRALRAQFAQKDGEWFNASLLMKGIENLKKAYGSQGFINFTGIPEPQVDEAKKQISININIDEGKPFFVSRIEFTGNTITRDKVIRRELLLQEGQVYNSQLWEMSLMRLNQLNYFETLKVDQDSESRQNQDSQTVDLLLKLKEKGKNSIGMNGGLSGLSGTFLGINYETNNFLGLGETLSLQANIGDLSRNLSFGFTEPYLHNRPISVGFQVFTQKYDYNPAKASTVTGSQSQNLSTAQQSLLTNYNMSTSGLTFSLSQPLQHLWAHKGVTRIGVSYALTRSSVTTFNDNTRNVFQLLAFRSGVQGLNALNGIVTSAITPSFSFSSLDRAVGPHSGRDINVAVQVAGVAGNVMYIQPVATYRQFYPIKGLKLNREGRNVLAYRVQFSHIEGFGGEVAPPDKRIYSGGESDVRGFDIRQITPYTFIPVKVMYNLDNPDGTNPPTDTTNPMLTKIQVPLPVYRLATIGGDTSTTATLEYRIPIVSQVQFAFFTDFNMTFDMRPSQLRQSVAGQAQLTGGLYGCPQIVNGACYGGENLTFPNPLQLVPHTNYVPRMSNGAELQVVLPIVNAPFRIYYAYNPLRLYRQIPTNIARPSTCAPADSLAACMYQFFPTQGTGPYVDAGRYSAQQVLQAYPDYLLREPRKTFRITVSTSF